MNKIEREKIEKETKSIKETSERFLSTDAPNSDYNVSRTRLRYSNRERRIIKRKQYDSISNEQFNVNTNTSANSADPQDTISEDYDDTGSEDVININKTDKTEKTNKNDKTDINSTIFTKVKKVNKN